MAKKSYIVSFVVFAFFIFLVGNIIMMNTRVTKEVQTAQQEQSVKFKANTASAAKVSVQNIEEPLQVQAMHQEVSEKQEPAPRKRQRDIYEPPLDDIILVQ